MKQNSALHIGKPQKKSSFLSGPATKAFSLYIVVKLILHVFQLGIGEKRLKNSFSKGVGMIDLKKI